MSFNTDVLALMQSMGDPAQEYQQVAAGLPLQGIWRDLWPLAQILLHRAAAPGAGLPMPPYSDPGLSVPPLHDPGMSAPAPAAPAPGPGVPQVPVPVPTPAPVPVPTPAPVAVRSLDPGPQPAYGGAFAAPPGYGTVYAAHAPYVDPAMSRGGFTPPRANPWVMLGSAILGELFGGAPGAIAGLGGAAQGYDTFRQQLTENAMRQQQLQTEAAQQQAQQRFMEAQARQAQIDALDRQIAQDDEFFRDPERLIRNGLAEPELLQAAVNEANLRRHERGYTGADLSYQAISRTVADFKRKYPEFYGATGWQWNAETKRYERTPSPPGAGGGLYLRPGETPVTPGAGGGLYLRPGETPVTPEQYQSRGPMGPPPWHPPMTPAPPPWHPPMTLPKGDAGPAFIGADPVQAASVPGPRAGGVSINEIPSREGGVYIHEAPGREGGVGVREIMPYGAALPPGLQPNPSATSQLPPGSPTSLLSPLLNAAAGGVAINEIPSRQGGVYVRERPGGPVQLPPGAAAASAAGVTVNGNQIQVPGVGTIAIPDSVHDLLRFDPQSKLASYLQAGFAPEHAEGMVAGEQKGLADKVASDMGIAEMPITLQKAALDMAVTAADIKLKLAQAVHEQNQPMIDLLNASLKQLEVSETMRHQGAQDDLAALGREQEGITSAEGSRQVQLQALFKGLDAMKEAAFAATAQQVVNNGGTTQPGVSALNALGGVLGQLFGLKAIGAVGGAAKSKGLSLNFAGMTDAEIAAAVSAARGTAGGAGMFASLARALGGVTPMGWLGITAAIAAGAGLAYYYGRDGKSHAVVTTEGRVLDPSVPEVAKYLETLGQIDSLSSRPTKPIPLTIDQMNLANQPLDPKLKALVGSMVASAGKTDRRGNVIPTFQDAYYSTLGQGGYAGELAAYRLLEAYMANYPTKALPIRLAQPNSPYSPEPYTPSGPSRVQK